MNDWKTVRLGDVCEKGSSNIAQNEITDNNGEYPIYGAAGFIKNVDFYKQEKPYIGIVKDGAGVGRVSIHPAKSSLIVTMQYIFPKENIDIKFLAEFLKYQNLSRFYTGATIPHIYFKDYQNIPLKLPSLQKQKLISAVLGKCTELIVKNKTILEKYDTLIKSRFIEMFGTEKDFSKWNCCCVEDVADVTVGVVIKPTQYYCEKGIPAFRSLNIGEMKVNDSDWVYFTEAGNEKNKKSILKENDVLVVRSGAPGKSCVITKKYEGYNVVDAIIAHPNLEKVNPVFLCMFTNMPHGMNQIKAKTGGAAQQHFNVGGYNALKMILPPLSLQNDFSAFVQQIDKSKFEIWLYINMCVIIEKRVFVYD